ncbi:MAG: UDP-3-O-(3-hydroxymyristoyl)glucosamine N-acyltransferase, partial [Terriglobales bacterium]
PGIHPTASIDPTAEVGPGSHVGAFAVVGPRCRLGAGAVLHPHVVLYPDVSAGRRLLAHAHVVIREGTRLGDDVVLQPGVVLGGDGFAFVRERGGRHRKIPQVGVVEIGNGVEIQANSCVDRASLEATCIRDGAKLDNLVQVAHNCEVGADALVCSQVGLAGSVQVGAGAILAGQAGVADHSVVGAGTVVTAQSGTHGRLRDGEMYSGSPAMEHRAWLRACALMPRLPDMQRELRRLAQQVARLEHECGC